MIGFMQIVGDVLISCGHAFAVVATGIFVFYVLRWLFSSTLRGRYTWVALYEVLFLWRSAQFFVISGGCYLLWIALAGGVWTFILAVGLVPVAAFFGGRALRRFLVFSYPFFMEKRLKHLRYGKRRSPEGRPLVRTSSSEADLYLDEGQKAEQGLKTMEYDVWLDEVTGYVKVQKYHGPILAIKCPGCEYRTLKVEDSPAPEKNVVSSETQPVVRSSIKKVFHREGVVSCHYCGYRKNLDKKTPQKIPAS